jgi:hypothetical protein
MGMGSVHPQPRIVQLAAHTHPRALVPLLLCCTDSSSLRPDEEAAAAYAGRGGAKGSKGLAAPIHRGCDPPAVAAVEGLREAAGGFVGLWAAMEVEVEVAGEEEPVLVPLHSVCSVLMKLSGTTRTVEVGRSSAAEAAAASALALVSSCSRRSVCLVAAICFTSDSRVAASAVSLCAMPAAVAPAAAAPAAAAGAGNPAACGSSPQSVTYAQLRCGSWWQAGWACMSVGTPSSEHSHTPVSRGTPPWRQPDVAPHS